ncbi:MarR family winged helix-turn-helix transcriptional regulator [Nocardioides KLBMP 9356]|uniref:MarR family winged helix-turn-helix transcriptional regulator n=1 Tax=Nocardioides potassii TaxID=2911371 RepID=A0ABS9HGA9_9ACTN|nr:MarR family winged helix-turn-helix transcriptional regulator [Nocardioides potassii]MCF6379148.1 MarR family winged helix-turn-helix transcriptional regulator [Nocardioides potassii]
MSNAPIEPRDLDLPTLASIAGSGVARSVLERIAAAGHVGVRPSHGYVIQRLVEDEPTISALAESLGMTQQGASKQVRDLEGLGYVERVTTPDDQRARRVRLTAAGRDVLACGRRARAEMEAEVVARVGTQHLEAARATLVALLGVTGLEDRVRTRSVPDPDDA